MNSSSPLAIVVKNKKEKDKEKEKKKKEKKSATKEATKEAKELEKAFPSPKLDSSKAVNTGTMTWTKELTTGFLGVLGEHVKKKGHTQDAGTFTALGWNIGCHLLNQKFGVCVEKNWKKTYFINKCKTKLQDLVIYRMPLLMLL